MITAAHKRERKKRRKNKTPQTSSLSLHCRARRRQRQWHARNAGFLGDVPLRAVFPSVVRPEMLGIMAGMDQKYFSRVLCAHRRLWKWHVQGWSFWCCSSRCVPVVGIGSGMCWLVLLVTIHLTLCFLLLSMSVAIPQVQFLVKVICPLLFRLVLLVRQRRKLWRFRSCRFSTSSFRFLSWCRGRFPWFCCSADHGDSPVAVLEQGDRRPCCAGRVTSKVVVTVAVLGQGVMPVVAGLVPVARQFRKLWFCRSCSSSQFVDLPVVVQRPISIAIPQLQYFFWLSMPLLCR